MEKKILASDINLFVSDSAVRQIQLMQDNDYTLEGLLFRIKIGGKGCEGFTYETGFSSLHEGDILIKKDYNINSWKDDLRVVLKQAGSKLIPTILNISDNSILNESFLEDINNIILNGEVPNLMQ